MRKIIVALLIGFIASCQNKPAPSVQTTQNNTPLTIAALTSQKTLLDSGIAKNNFLSECFFPDSGKFTKGNCDRKEYTAKWNTWKNNKGTIVSAMHSYSGESMDIYVEDKFYYNTNGNLFCLHRLVNFLNNICSDKAITHSKTYYYNNALVSDSIISLYDSDNKAQSPDSCLIPYAVDVKIPLTIAQLNDVLKLN